MTLVVPETGHRWLYERPRFRAEVARFFAESLGGVDPFEAAERAAACDVVRPADTIDGFGALGGGPAAALRRAAPARARDG